MKYDTVRDKKKDGFERDFRNQYLHGHSYTKLLSVKWQTVEELIALVSSYNPLDYDALLLVWPVTEVVRPVDDDFSLTAPDRAFWERVDELSRLASQFHRCIMVVGGDRTCWCNGKLPPII